MPTMQLASTLVLQDRQTPVSIRTIKVSSEEGVLDVLGAPYFGPIDGKDSYGTYFSPRTDFLRHKLPYPPVVYWHGQRTNSRNTEIGEVRDRWNDAEGEWFRVHLNLDLEESVKVWNAAKIGRSFGSTGAVPALIDLADDGEILQWFVGELTLVDLAPEEGRVPSNFYAVARPRLEEIARTHVLESARTEFLEGTVLSSGGSADAPIEPESLEDPSKGSDPEEPEDTENKNTEDNTTMNPEEMAAAIEALQSGMAEMQESIRTMTAAPSEEEDPEEDVNDTRTEDAPIEPAAANEVAELRAELTSVRTDLAARTHASWVQTMIAEGRVTPGERETLILAMSNAFNTGGEPQVANLRTIVEARVPAEIVSSESSLRVAGFGENDVQSQVDAGYMSRLSGYVANAGHTPTTSPPATT